MNKSKQTIEESLNKIKFMMNYDSSRTLIENTKAVNEQTESPGSMVGKTAAATGIAAGAGAIGGGIAGAAAGGSIVGGGATLVGTTLAPTVGFAAAGAIGAAAIAGAGALALVPLVLWLADKDKAYPKTKKLFDYVKNNKDKIDQVERGLDDDTIQQLSDQLYDAMKGLGTRNKQVYAAFNSLVTISDFAALIATFNEDHLDEGDGDLLEWLDDDFDISSMWNQIYVPLRNIVKKFAKKMASENTTKKGVETGVRTGGYKPAQGTNEDPYKLGTSGAGIFKVQECLGVVTDGKFGPKTQAKMMELAKQYVNVFTDADIDTICKLATPRRDMTIAPIKPIDPIANYNPKAIKMTPLAPKMKPTLASEPKTSTSTTPQSPLTGRDKRIANRINRLQNKQNLA